MSVKPPPQLKDSIVRHNLNYFCGLFGNKSFIRHYHFLLSVKFLFLTYIMLLKKNVRKENGDASSESLYCIGPIILNSAYFWKVICPYSNCETICMDDLKRLVVREPFNIAHLIDLALTSLLFIWRSFWLAKKRCIIVQSLGKKIEHHSEVY